MIHIDGRMGEGGGQILRSALALSIATGRSLRIDHIRKNRKPHGLKAQHLAGVLGAARISSGEALGAGGRPVEVGETVLDFRPGQTRPGQYLFEIGTAGSTGLLLHGIYLPLLLAGARTDLELVGGTHVPWSPTYDDNERIWSAALAAVGANVTLSMERAGWYPKGGGRIRARIEPWRDRRPIDWTDRGALRSVEARSVASNLPDHVGRRQYERAEARLARLGLAPDMELRTPPSIGQGTSVFVALRYERGLASFVALGEIGKRAEVVAEEACGKVADFLSGTAAVDEHLADQILLPLAFVPGTSRFTTRRVTRHLTTNADVVRAFGVAEIAIEGAEGEPGLVTVTAASR